MKPIIFSTEMTKALLDNRKTMTRRVIKPQPELNDKGFWQLGDAFWSKGVKSFNPMPGHSLCNRLPYKPGDILWVREAWIPWDSLAWNIQQYLERNGKKLDFVYKTDFEFDTGKGWKPSIHMPKEAARIFLRVIDIRVECLCQITTFDAIAEGFSSGERESETDAFYKYWNKLNAKRGYGKESDPWVWVYTFERTEKSWQRTKGVT